MSDTRTYIVPDGQENSTNQMLPWMAMMNGGIMDAAVTLFGVKKGGNYVITYLY